jgi:site-specific DNA recombinase
MSDGHSVKRGVIYARVSSEEQDKKGYSLPSQNRYLKERMKADGVVPVREPIIDVETGRTSEREGLKLLWSLARSGAIDYVYVYDQDRLGRHVAETPYLMWKLKEETGVVVRTMTREYNFADPIDFVFAVLESYAGHVESDKIGERTQRGKTEKFLSGKWIGPVPFGYRKNADSELEKVSELERIVCEIFKTYEMRRDLRRTTNDVNLRYAETIGKLSMADLFMQALRGFRKACSVPGVLSLFSVSSGG